MNVDSADSRWKRPMVWMFVHPLGQFVYLGVLVGLVAIGAQILPQYRQPIVSAGLLVMGLISGAAVGRLWLHPSMTDRWRRSHRLLPPSLAVMTFINYRLGSDPDFVRMCLAAIALSYAAFFVARGLEHQH